MDLIIKNAKIITMDDRNPEVSAMAISAGKIQSVGNENEILSLGNVNTKIIDLDGKLVLPGFNDSHMHLLSYGFSLERVVLTGVSSIEEIIKRINTFIDEKHIEKGRWIQGIGWNQDYFTEPRFPTRYDLDKISKDHPICVIRACYHVAVVNSKALELMGINKGSQQIEGGAFDIDDSGEPIGIFRESAVRLIYDTIPEPNIDEIKDILHNAAINASTQGITSIQSDDFEHIPSKHYNKIICAYKELIAEGKLSVRINEQCLLPSYERLNRFLDEGYRTGMGDEQFKIGPLKILTDGSLGARTALLREPYNDQKSTTGISVYDQDTLNKIVIKAHTSGMQIAVHCIGDQAMYMAFEAFEKAEESEFRSNHRHSIVHCQITDEILLNKFKELNIIAHIQPIFLDYDLHIVEQRVGLDRASTSYNWKTMLKKGIKIACGSDCPVEKLDVLPNIYCAVTRKDLRGTPENGWLPEQKLTVYEAVAGFTKGGAYASFEEDIKGTLTEGKLADFVVLSEDIFNIDVNKIKDVKVLMTFLGGKSVYNGLELKI